MKKIGVIGAGAWGTALAIIANRAGADAVLWTRNRHVIDSIKRKNQNDPYLPDVFLDPAIKVTRKLEDACVSDMVLVVVPAQHVRSTCIAMSDYLDSSVPVVLCSKGVERGSLQLMSEVATGVLPDNPIAVLSGPNFAKEAAQGLPTATAIACQNPRVGEQIVFSLGTSLFRPYLNNDLIGTQVGGAVKNVIAVACGIAMGRQLGENARSALLTRSLSEIRRLCIARGGREETLMGLSGYGDLILTCTSPTSRNTTLGAALGAGMPVEQAINQGSGVVEGVASAESVKQLADQLNVDMPICKAVYSILYEDAAIDESITALLDRPFARENH